MGRTETTQEGKSGTKNKEETTWKCEEDKKLGELKREFAAERETKKERKGGSFSWIKEGAFSREGWEG